MLARLETASLTASPREQYEVAKSDGARTLEFVLAKTGVSKSAMARTLGISTQLVGQMCSSSSGKNLPWAAVLCAPPIVRHEFAEMLAAECGCVLIARECAETSNLGLDVLSSTLRLASSTIADAIDARGDGKIDAREADRLIHPAKLAAKAMMGIVATLERAIELRGLVLK